MSLGKSEVLELIEKVEKEETTQVKMEKECDCSCGVIEMISCL